MGPYNVSAISGMRTCFGGRVRIVALRASNSTMVGIKCSSIRPPQPVHARPWSLGTTILKQTQGSSRRKRAPEGFRRHGLQCPIHDFVVAVYKRVRQVRERVSVSLSLILEIERVLAVNRKLTPRQTRG